MEWSFTNFPAIMEEDDLWRSGMKQVYRRLALWLFPLTFVVLFSACATTSGGDDAGISDADAYAEDGDTNKPEGDTATQPDLDFGDDYGLLIPTGFQACSQAGFISGVDVPAVLSMFARVTFKPGFYRLDKDQTSFEADLIEQVEWNREPQIAIPTGPGIFTRTDDLYTYTQTVAFGPELMQIEMRASFAANGGPDPGQIIELNESSFTNYWVSLAASIDVTSMYLTTCSCDTFDHRVVDYTLDDGDILSVEVCSICPGICKSSIGKIPRAEVTFSSQSRTITDQMQLAIVFGQHDWSGKMIVHLQEPLAGYAGLVLSFGNLLGGQTVDLYDENLQVIETKTVANTEHRSGW
jgi:hypothetical protein